MMKKTFKAKNYLAPRALVLCFALLISWGASADPIGTAGPVPGCEKKVLDAMGHKANARVAYDVASTEQVIDKPDSILAMTCFNNAAAEGARQLGQMFSGDFTNSLSKIIPDSLESFYDDYAQSDGYNNGQDQTVPATGTVDYSVPAATQLTAAGTTKDCDFIQKLWDQQKSEGIQKDVPYPLYSDLITGTQPVGVVPATANSNFEKDWKTSDGTDNDFKQVGTDIAALPQAAPPATLMTSPINTDDDCAVLVKLGVTCPP